VHAGHWRRARGCSYKATLFQHPEGLHLPDAIRRRKQGFVLPYEAWIRTALETPGDSCLPDLPARLDRDAYRPLVAAYLDGRLHWSSIWALYVLERISARQWAHATPLTAATVS
jgi:hypothetical protein